MDKEQFAEYAELREKASLAIECGDWVLRLLVEEAHGVIHAIGIAQGADGHRVVYRMWDHEADRAKLRSPVERLRHPRLLEPSIETRTRSADAGELDSLIRELSELRLSVTSTAETITLDGCLRAVFVARGRTRSEFSMAGACPAEWEALGAWFDSAWRGLSRGVVFGHEALRMIRPER